MKILVLGALLLLGCAGADGVDGEDGKRGAAGEDAELLVQNASAEQCPAGGYVLTSGESEAVVCNGEDGEAGDDGSPGEPGAAGEAGAPGPAGEDGADAAGASIGKIVYSITCVGDVSGSYSLEAYQSVAVFADGSVWTSARITDGINSGSESAFYAPEQVGAGAAIVLIGYDVVPPTIGGFWTFSFDVIEFRSVITYTDSDLSAGSETWALPGSACVVNEY